ncbi:MAG: hypothetical protein U5P10_12750 [Spirochaetia bacterium]|nr:hypothetical protein [Spirochaetia bacterium]
MKRNLFVIAIILGTMMVTPAIFAGGAQEASDGDFPGRLETALVNSDFNSEEALDIAEAARELSWEEAENADPEVVARALSLAKKENAELDPEQNAELALELAQNAVRLENENYEDAVVAQATLEAVRTMLGQIEEWKSGDMSENLGEIVRSTVSTEAKKAAQKRASENKGVETSKDKTSEATSGTPAEGTTDSSDGDI